jgi:homoserine O-succinyltransferase
MPVIIPKDLPAKAILDKEYIFSMSEERARTQDIRPLRLALVNLMPTKIVTETQFMRLLSNTPLQVDIDLIAMSTHESKNTSKAHLYRFYKTFEDIKHQKYDGMIITGAPVEMLDFSEVNYWEELESIMDFANTNVYSTLFICWASQAALYYYYGVEKYPLEEKMFGIFSHQLLRVRDITKGFDDEFFAPHSRHTENRPQDLAKLPQLKILAQSDEAGVLLSATTDQRHYFISGHMEYDALTLKEEYERDLKKAQSGVSLPKAYFPHDDPSLEPIVKWRAHANLLYSNWLNHVVYQNTPYDLEKLQPREELI